MVAQVEVKSFDSPDEVRPFEGNGQVDLVTIGGMAVGRATFDPGWKWSQNVKPIAGTDSCQTHHFGYVISGRMRVQMEDGSDAELGPGDAYTIPPGHDAEVVGDEAMVALEFGDAATYAKQS